MEVNKFKGKVETTVMEVEGQVLALGIAVGDHLFTLASIYAPNDFQQRFMRNGISQIMQTPGRDELVVGGFQFGDEWRSGSLSTDGGSDRGIIKRW